ncbi:MAG: hypothetical protein QM539_07180 [Alphaproteobacteria bacterium]|nr:hypothetical protein [Alphaproteobacteria bacterium]
MINDNDSIKAISLENNDFENIPEFVQIDNIKNEIINKDSNFVFFFGVSASGKSVILSLMLYYLNSKAGVLKPQKIPKEANVLLIDFYDKLSRGILPDRTTRDKVTRLDFVFEQNSKSKKIKPINLTFLETVGEVKSNEDTEKITLLNLGTAEILSNWLYESIVGYPLNYQGTFWERLKFDF